MHTFPFLVILGRITFFLVFSFVLVHLLAFFGFFLAIAYPLWWLVFPKSVICLFCRAQKEGKRCLVCREPVYKGEMTSPRSFRCAVYNGLAVLFVSLICLLLVFAEYKLLFQQLLLAPRTVSFTIPSKASYRLDEIFPMRIEITDLKVAINAVQADIGFDSQRLEAVDISTEGSFATIFIQKEINNKVGYARLSGGLPNPGFFGQKGIFGTIFFRGKSPGLAKVEFLPSSLVLANNGRGSNVLKEFGLAYYLILPERISGKEKEQQKAIIKPEVLGEASAGTQLKFYEEENVLSEETTLPKKKPVKWNDWEEAFLSFLEHIDRFILSFWRVKPSSLL